MIFIYLFYFMTHIEAIRTPVSTILFVDFASNLWRHKGWISRQLFSMNHIWNYSYQKCRQFMVSIWKRRQIIIFKTKIINYKFKIFESHIKRFLGKTRIYCVLSLLMVSLNKTPFNNCVVHLIYSCSILQE